MTANQPPETPPDATHTNESFAGKSRRSVLAGKLGFAAYRASRPADSGVLL